MNVAKGSRVRLLTRKGEIEYGIQATVTLSHFIEVLSRLEALDSEPDVEGSDLG